MGTLTISDDALLAKHIHDPELQRRILDLAPDEPLRLLIEDHLIIFRKSGPGADGTLASGLTPDPDDALGRAVWAALQAKRGESVRVSLADPKPSVDPYLAYLDELFWEWKTPEDAAAFDDL